MPPAAALAPTEPPAPAKAGHPSAACTSDRGACLHRRPAPRKDVTARTFVRLPQSTAVGCCPTLVPFLLVFRLGLLASKGRRRANCFGCGLLFISSSRDYRQCRMGAVQT